jgi:catechol 2,3-dioxygenase-like lactoylglutathione lyase family enzyme
LNNLLSPNTPIPRPSRIVRDYDEAIAWFTGVLGFTLVEHTYQPEQNKPWVLVAPPGAGDNAATLLPARASTPEQAVFIGNQARLPPSSPRTRSGVHLLRPREWKRRMPDQVRHDEPRGVAMFEDLYREFGDLVQFRSA